mmetsp:Transcript_8219/g.9806  ORF Transcript_8219/g.9806 Transcript_8219/m.9806 type:complete len:113 (-) Transcript_8219:424-762(-)
MSSKVKEGLTSIPSIGFAAVSVDDHRNSALLGPKGGLSPHARWQHLEHFHLPSESIHLLGISIVPTRMVIDCRSGRIVRCWDGTHGNVLKGNHGKSRQNGSHDLLGTLASLL